jgi:hypothetical protein
MEAMLLEGMSNARGRMQGRRRALTQSTVHLAPSPPAEGERVRTGTI